MKIGIMGGTFYPLHNGHLKLAKYALEQYNLDTIWFMPNKVSPHKMGNAIEDTTHHRVAMVQLAIYDNDKFVYQPYEVEHTEVSYSYKTVQYFKNAYPNDDFYFIIGADSLLCFDKWRCPEEILKCCTLLVAGRDGVGIAQLRTKAEDLIRHFGGDICLLEMPFEDISSTEIREELFDKPHLQEFLPQSVFSYIIEHELFLPEAMLALKEQLYKVLDKERYEHSIGVMKTAGLLAQRYQFDVKRAMIAGLLHDCAKCIPGKEKLRMCIEAKLPVSDVEQKSPGLLHAKLGAHLARAIYGVEDEELLDSICYHCTGRPQMTLFDKIIYIADYIEPNRDKAPNLANIRKLAYFNIDECLLAILKSTLDYLEDSRQLVDPMTAKTYEYYSEIVK